MTSRIASPLGTGVATKRYAGVLVGAVAVAVGIASVVSGSLPTLADKIQAASAGRWLSMIADRSPGTRTTAELTKTKHARVAAGPHQRALGKIRRADLPKEFLRALVPGVEFAEQAPPGVFLNPVIGVPAPQFAMAEAPPVGGIGGPGSPGIGSPGGGVAISSPGASTPGNPPTTDVPGTNIPSVTPAVPEPGTWGMMLLGFAFLGGSLRRRSRPLGVASRVV
ncbi:MAG: PEPxxWA-CTERM sorting domain-containing protein [Sphingomicrobium sp.]